MLVGAAAASITIGCVVRDVKTVAGAASAAAVPLEMACARTATVCKKKNGCRWVCVSGLRSECDPGCFEMLTLVFFHVVTFILSSCVAGQLTNCLDIHL